MLTSEGWSPAVLDNNHQPSINQQNKEAIGGLK